MDWEPDSAVLAERERVRAEHASHPALAPRHSHVLGLDLGQTTDYTALVLDEVTARGTSAAVHDIRYLRRWPLRTPYPTIVAHVAALTQRAPLSEEDTLVVDQTGVGRAVVDLLRGARLGVSLAPVTITAGAGLSHAAGEYHVPKRDLVAAITVLLQDGRLRIASKLAEAAVLVDELSVFQTKITLSANEVSGAWREGAHDDTVLAVALAVWYAEHAAPGTGGVWLL
jgi:hypothetical protein